jgi:hypothetical protein
MFPKHWEGFVSFYAYIKISASIWPLRTILFLSLSLLFITGSWILHCFFYSAWRRHSRSNCLYLQPLYYHFEHKFLPLINSQQVLTFVSKMFPKFVSSFLLPALLLSSLSYATQIDRRSVGALTPLSSKTKICNILNYGAVADNKTDIGPSIKSAFSSCAISGGATIYIPPGSYSRTLPLRIVQLFTNTFLLFSPNWRGPKQRLSLRPPNRRPDHSNFRRFLLGQRNRNREHVRRRSLLLQRPRRHQRPRLHYAPDILWAKRTPLPLHLLHLDFDSRHHLRRFANVPLGV